MGGTAPSRQLLHPLFLHCFMMFGPMLLFSAPHAWIAAAILFFGGPVLGSYVTTNMCEQPAIWCFFSVSQICIITAWMFFAQAKMCSWRMFKSPSAKED